jgi:Neocarzinostatin family
VKKVKFLAAVPVAAAALIALAPTASAAATASLTVSPSSGLKDGSSVSFSGTGFVKSTTIYVLECHGTTPSQAACDTPRLVPAQSDATGKISGKITVHTGTIGDGTCAAGGTCTITASDAGGQASGVATITFASASTSSGGSSSSSSGSSGSGSTPSTVSAGSGGGADRNGAPVGVIVLASLGAAAVIGGGVRFARR